MLDSVFLQVLNMSYTASYVILAVLLVRLLLRKAPKSFSYALWSVVLFRLVCPWSFESAFSLLSIGGRTTEQLQPFPEQFVTLGTVRGHVDTNGGGMIPSPVSPAPKEPLFENIFALIWLIGIAALMIYSVVMLLKLKKQLKGAVHDTENIYLCAGLSTPFVMGAIQPRIYLPLSLSETEKRYILLHEKTHIRRFDHLIKLVGFLVLCMHWFNPLVWVTFFLSGRDMEMSCDETVIKKLGSEVKKEYSSSLLSLATGRRMIGGIPLAFGEGDTKSRIKNVLNYKKPAFWISLVAVVAVICVMVGLMANPKDIETGASGINAIILEIDKDNQTMTVEGIDENSVIGDKCILTWESNPFMTLATNSGPKHLSLDDFSIGDHVVLFIGEVQESYPTRAKAKTIQLQPQPKERHAYSAENLWKARTQYVGDNSAISKLIGLLPVPEGIQYDHFELHTSEQPYDIEIVYSVPAEELRKHDTKNAPAADVFSKNALLLLALVDNADGVRAVLTDGEREVGFINGREWADYTVGEDVRNYAESPEKLQELIAFAQKTAITESGEQESIDPLEAAISSAILDREKGSSDSEFICESHVTLATEGRSPAGNSDNIDMITVYAMVLVQKYNFVNDGLDKVGGSHIPTAITFDVNESGEYTLKEYWIPRDGSYYGSDIKEKFPSAIWEDALDTQKYILAQIQSCYAQAINYEQLDTVPIIENLFDTLMSSPAGSSNPDDYINAHRLDYRELTYYGDYTLRYIFSEFIKGSQTGLKGRLMWIVMDDLIAGEGMPMAAESGQEYFDAWREHGQKKLSSIGEDEMRENYPKSYLMLTMLSDME